MACTEMVSAKGLIYGERSRKGNQGTKELLLTTPLPGFPATERADAPLVVQLFGEDASFLGEATALLREWGFTHFDLNLGCSVPKVVKTGAGAALARNLPATLKVAEAMLKAAGPGRVGFKFRLGWSKDEENYLALGQALQDAGAAWLTLHPRYARQAFNGQADWQALAKLKKYVNIPLIASGDLFCAADAVNCMERGGADAVMFARGAMQNPAVFAEYLSLVTGSGQSPLDESEAVRARAARIRRVVLRHAELARAMPQTGRPDEEKKPPMSLLKMRGAIPRYVKELPGSRLFRQDMSKCGSWRAFYEIVDLYFSGVENTPLGNRDIYAGN